MTIDINAIRMQVERYTGFAGDSQSSLAHRLAAQVPALLNEREVLRAQVADLANKLHKAQQENASHTKAATAWANEVAAKDRVIEAATYEYGSPLCLDRECDHVTEDDGPCPFIETRYATAAEILAVEALLMSSDGDPLDDGEEIPVGEIRRVLGEAPAEVA